MFHDLIAYAPCWNCGKRIYVTTTPILGTRAYIYCSDCEVSYRAQLEDLIYADIPEVPTIRSFEIMVTES